MCEVRGEVQFVERGNKPRREKGGHSTQNIQSCRTETVQTRKYNRRSRRSCVHVVCRVQHVAKPCLNQSKQAVSTEDTNELAPGLVPCLQVAVANAQMRK
jgi:hypothetical protein